MRKFGKILEFSGYKLSEMRHFEKRLGHIFPWKGRKIEKLRKYLFAKMSSFKADCCNKTYHYGQQM